MIYQICDVMMSISTWDRVHFWIYFLSHNSLTHQTWPVDRYKQGKYFSEIVWTIWGTGAKFQALFNLASCSNFSITNYVKFPVFHFFWKGEDARIKIGKYQPLKIDRSLFFSNCYLAAPLGHSQGDDLTNLMLITAFYLCWPEGHWEPHNEVGSLSPFEHLGGFELGIF